MERNIWHHNIRKYVILIKAGLSLNLSDLKKVGRPAVMMSFLPASFEILGYFILAPLLVDRGGTLVCGVSEPLAEPDGQCTGADAGS